MTSDSLLSRLSSLTGPDRGVDGEIALAHGWTREKGLGISASDSRLAYWRSPSGLLSAPEPVRLELAAKLNPWRRIETAPFESAKRFWLGKPDAVPIIGWRYYRAGPWISDGINMDGYQPTHYQDLPAPPSEDKA